jgi:hypothetical protein
MPTLPPLPDDTPEHLRALVEELDRRQEAFDAEWPKVMELRRRYFVERTKIAKLEMDAAIERAQRARVELDAAVAATLEAAGIDPDDLAEKKEVVGDPFPRLSRASIVDETPAATAYVEDHLPEAIELIERHAPNGWLEREPADLFRLSSMADEQPVSIVKGVRLESERPKGHRLRQAITLAKDYLDNDPRYDHFGGALAVTQLAQLGRRVGALRAVGGSQERIDALYSGADTDAIMFELLVAAACSAKGRAMVFVEPTSVKSPDLRSTDAFNMVIECKRSAALTVYEVDEEARMRSLFRLIKADAMARGQFGTYEVAFSVEASAVDMADVAATCLRQRLAAHPERSLAYSWGTVAFRPLPRRVDLDEVTKAYSPIMLDEVFGWKLDMPSWDGFICQIDGPPAAAVDQVRSPVGLAWRVDAEAAITKRSRAPVGLFAKALKQVPSGEFGLVYVAYPEGARSDVADNRTRAYMERINQWEHDGAIRIPATFLVRQFPLPTGHGNPDMVENTIRFLSEEGGGDEWIFREYPAAIFTSKD